MLNSLRPEMWHMLQCMQNAARDTHDWVAYATVFCPPTIMVNSLRPCATNVAYATIVRDALRHTTIWVAYATLFAPPYWYGYGPTAVWVAYATSCHHKCGICYHRPRGSATHHHLGGICHRVCPVFADVLVHVCNCSGICHILTPPTNIFLRKNGICHQVLFGWWHMLQKYAKCGMDKFKICHMWHIGGICYNKYATCGICYNTSGGICLFVVAYATLQRPGVVCFIALYLFHTCYQNTLFQQPISAFVAVTGVKYVK